jgi:hypothetical protein
MSKSVVAKYCGWRPTKDFDHTLMCALDALRKPLKLTATQKRRALKKRAGKVGGPAREHGR